MHSHGWSIQDLYVFLGGSTAIGIIGHAVSTFPTPKSPLGQWFLGVIQFIVGQRLQAKQTIGGQENVNLLATQAINPPAKIEVIAEPVKKIDPNESPKAETK